MSNIIFSTTIQATSRSQFDTYLELEAQEVFGEEEYHIVGNVSVTGVPDDTGKRQWFVTLKSGPATPEAPPAPPTPDEQLINDGLEKLKNGEL